MVQETIDQRKERHGAVTRVAKQLGIGTESLRRGVWRRGDVIRSAHPLRCGDAACFLKLGVRDDRQDSSDQRLALPLPGESFWGLVE